MAVTFDSAAGDRHARATKARASGKFSTRQCKPGAVLPKLPMAIIPRSCMECRSEFLSACKIRWIEGINVFRASAESASLVVDDFSTNLRIPSADMRWSIPTSWEVVTSSSNPESFCKTPSRASSSNPPWTCAIFDKSSIAFMAIKISRLDRLKSRLRTALEISASATLDTSATKTIASTARIKDMRPFCPFPSRSELRISPARPLSPCLKTSSPSSAKCLSAACPREATATDSSSRHFTAVGKSSSKVCKESLLSFSNCSAASDRTSSWNTLTPCTIKLLPSSEFTTTVPTSWSSKTILVAMTTSSRCLSSRRGDTNAAHKAGSG
mmetsp:Transcript_1552/g.2410  ORF Transcript_1552/g.2410 Transcript_1552/m.2410 type:complete len:326 (-) Transcript_1552:98-1075(-)